MGDRTAIIVFFTVVIIVIFSIYLNVTDLKKIDRCHILSVGKIINVYDRVKSGSSVEVQYNIDAKLYRHVKSVQRNHFHFIGKKVVIKIACEDPDILRIVDTLTVNQFYELSTSQSEVSPNNNEQNSN